MRTDPAIPLRRPTAITRIRILIRTPIIGVHRCTSASAGVGGTGARNLTPTGLHQASRKFPRGLFRSGPTGFERSEPKDGAEEDFWNHPELQNFPELDQLRATIRRPEVQDSSEDGFDPGTFVLAGLFAGEGQLRNSNRAFGQGVAGCAQYYGTAYGYFLIGD